MLGLAILLTIDNIVDGRHYRFRLETKVSKNHSFMEKLVKYIIIVKMETIADV